MIMPSIQDIRNLFTRQTDSAGLSLPAPSQIHSITSCTCASNRWQRRVIVSFYDSALEPNGRICFYLVQNIGTGHTECHATTRSMAQAEGLSKPGGPHPNLIGTPDLDPVTFLDFDRHEPFTGKISPYRIDCAVTTGSQGSEAAPSQTGRAELSV
jgi:hypothetical protein